MTPRTALCAAFVAFVALGCRQAPGDAQGAAQTPAASAVTTDVVVEGAWIRLPPPPATVAAGYLEIDNRGDDDRLLAVEGDAAERIEIHEMREVDGVMRMRELAGGLPIAAGTRVALAPGGNHLMLTGARPDLAAGQRLDATLVFERAGRMTVTFDVRTANGRPVAPRGDREAGSAHGDHVH